METRGAHLRTLRGLTIEELDGKIEELKKELFHLRFQLVAGRIENPSKIRWTRREIARLSTIREERRQEARKGAVTS